MSGKKTQGISSAPAARNEPADQAPDSATPPTPAKGGTCTRRATGGPLPRRGYLARLGGDEFVVLAGNLARPDTAQTIARKLIETVGQSFTVAGHTFTVTASIGISLCPLDGEEATGLLRRADGAMYRAKQQGKNRYVVFGDGPALHAQVAAHIVASGERV